ncbi:hypothetical protein conserved [Leishmania donovani]|uniref:Uncharacterized protein n=3 Tax=Leishmania donovani species complex TaxID=38574 RepID=A4I4C4_LEIIN|nr:conserved hypothetical protein [Leishmania infantum JPCM5]CAC9507517.1 hypothetical_protein_-_conserved [Leishmania infantum]CAJ1990541.1 hypothetical protein conserved [Leishmania donovani]CAM69632.1 conserved hypothetical protein [Leishmania infantum JPCM5]SUZ43570.1 hypothetical_protein_-_conserved [Leishmania infantum]VDZ46396.1 hypothetical_protein_conserved [Leishmania donovani]|eukprot:XP_001466593.1 conserved hypothetical protein [Leishmania infantum JPCM5]
MKSGIAPPTLSFKRKAITETASAAHGCLLVYPVSKKSKQRVAVGDSTGLFKVFSVGKRLEPVVAFETPETVAQTGESGAEKEKKAITAATLFSDQLFYIQGSVLHAYSRKGKPFFTVDTNVTERVHSLAIETPFIFLAGDFMVTTMSERKELGFFLAPDRVNDMCVYIVPSAVMRDGERQLGDYVSCLACNDRVLRLVQANKLVEEVSCEAALTTVVYHSVQRLLFYGTQSGSIGVMAVADNGSVHKVGAHMPDGPRGTITSLGFADVNADGQDELLVGYDDGTVCVMVVHLSRSMSITGIDAVQLTLVWAGSVEERVMSVAGGIITHTAAQPDVLVHTFSGQVVAFTLDTDEPRGDTQAAAAEAAAKQAALIAKQQDTQGEIAQLRALVAQRTRELSEVPVLRKAEEAPVLTVSAGFKMSVTLTPVEAMPMLSLVVSADASLEGMLIQCNAALTFVSTDNTAVKTRVVGGGAASTSPSTQSATAAVGSSTTIATVTPVQRGSKRLEVHMWGDEGVADTLRATVYSAQAPRTAQVKYVPLCALPLYERVPSVDKSVLSGDVVQSMSRLIVLGTFQVQDARMWLGQLVPGIVDALHLAEEQQRFVFTSRFSGSVLTVDIEDDQDGDKGSRAIFACNSLVTLATVKRHIVQVCAERGLNISTREHILCQTVLHQLQQLYPLMSSMSSSQRRWQLLQGLRELQGSETNLDFLPNLFQEVLASAEEVQAEAEAEAQQEGYLKRAVAALYRSFVYFKGHAPLFSEAIRVQLEAASCGLSFDPAALEKIMYPGDTTLQEAAAVEVAAMSTTALASMKPAAYVPLTAPTIAHVAGDADAECPALADSSEAPSHIASSASLSD